MAGTGGIRAGRAYVELFAQLKPLEKGLRQARAKLQAFSNSVQNIGRQLFNVAAIGAAPLAFATVTYANFAAQMSEVKAITGSTAEQFDRLEAKARELGATTSFSASQVAEGMKYLGMAGFNTEQIIAGIPGVLNLARAGAVELGMAADIASDVGSAFGLAADEIGHIADVMAVTASSANTNIEMMGETLKYAAPLAKAAGQSLEDTSAALGVMANSGIKASMAGTDLALIMKKIGYEARAGLAKVGVETIDAEGNVRSVLDVMRELGDATRNMSEGERLEFFAANFDRAAKSAIIMADAGDTMSQLREKIGNAEGAAARMAETMGDNLHGAFIRMMSALEGVQIAVGKAIEGPLSSFLDWVSGVLAAIERFTSENQWLVATFAALVVTAGTAAAGLLTLALALKLAAAGISVLLGLLYTVGTMAGLISLPLTAAAAAALALGAAFIYFSGAGSWAVEQLGRALQWLRDTVFPVLESIWLALSSGRYALAGQILWAGLRVAFYSGMKAILDALENWEGKVAGIFGRMALQARSAFLQVFSSLPGLSKKARMEMAFEMAKTAGKLSQAMKMDWGEEVEKELNKAKGELADLQKQVAKPEAAAATPEGGQDTIPGQAAPSFQMPDVSEIGNQVQQAWSLAVGSTNSFAAGRIGVQARPMQKVETELQGVNDKLAKLIEQGEEDLAFGE